MKIRITLNGEPREYPARITVAALLGELSLTPSEAAVERNGRLVVRAAHTQTELEDGDTLEVVTLVGGG